MRAGEPDPGPEPIQPPGSLAQKLGEAARGWRWRMPKGGGEGPHAHDWKLAAGLAALIAAGPLLTLGGATLLTSGANREIAKLRHQAEPLIARAERMQQERRQLAAVLGRPTLAATLDALARALPPDATLVRLERDNRGLLAAEVATPDPDRLRTTLREEPALALLRDAGQHQGDAMMVVSLSERAP